jgi:branched-chain amino acid transport system substrate-binding protein
MGPDGIFEQEWIEAAGEAAEGTYITFGGVPPDQLTGAGKDFVDAYNAKYPDQKPEAYTAYGYEAAKVLLAAIETASATNPADNDALRAAIRDAVFATKDYAGVLGTWSFTDEGDTSLTDMSGNTVTGGEFVFDKVIKEE